ncbi:DNA glycosylase [Bombardia bombarda]|uniref:DNA glycosylase n=1 Tax=Bombardia bombarda TaxID=252184 RepID=A0AA39XKX0_9PEZI|nr:DNA glycosylase [Bombardia bombarda]
MPPPPSPAKSKGKPRKRKAADINADIPAPLPEAPSTPQKRRARPQTPPPPPATPTPSAVRLIAEGVHANASPRRKPRSAAVNRLADPSRSNATLLSPQTSRIVAPKPVEAVSPSKVPRIQSRTTTANLLQEACAHLIKVDERMRPLIAKHTCEIFSPEGLAEQIDPFEALVSSIISQQVSGAAAKAIKGRFVALFNTNEDDSGNNAKEENGKTGPVAPVETLGESKDGNNNTTTRHFPHPSQVATTSIETLRTAGLSQRKAEYVTGIAEKFMSGDLTTEMLANAPYEELVEKLVAVRGLGRWSVEMFACFALKRMDVFSLGDLGVQRGMAAFVGRDVAKLKGKGGKWKYMTESDMEEISDRFRPYRSLFMWYMWRVTEETGTDVSTLEK